MATSLKNRCFQNLADLNDGVIGDDFVHGALETWKIKGKTSKGGKWDYKGKFKHSQKDGQLSGSLSNEVKIQFPYENLYFWFGTRGNDVKLHVDLGNHKVGGQEVNLFSNLKTQTNFKTFAFRLGAIHQQGDLSTSYRVEANSNTECHTSTNLSQRTFYRNKNLLYGLVTGFSLKDGSGSINKYDAIVGYEKDNTNVYLQHFSNAKASKLSVGTVQATLTHKQDDQEVGAEVVRNFADKSLSATLAASTKVNGATLKTRINNKLDLELSWKKKLNDTLTLTSSAKLALAKGAGAVDFSKIVPLPFGVQLEVNV